MQEMDHVLETVFVLGAVFEIIVGLYQIITKKAVGKERQAVYTEESLRAYAPYEGLTVILSAFGLVALVLSGEGKPFPGWVMFAGFGLLIVSVILLWYFGKKLLVRKDKM